MLNDIRHPEFDVLGFRAPLPDHGQGVDDRLDLYIS